jgi:hypothetical protein
VFFASVVGGLLTLPYTTLLKKGSDSLGFDISCVAVGF